MVLFYFALATSSPSLFEDLSAAGAGPGGGFLWEVGRNSSRPERGMKELNAGMALRHTLRPASQIEQMCSKGDRKHAKFYENICDFTTTAEIICAQKS